MIKKLLLAAAALAVMGVNSASAGCVYVRNEQTAAGLSLRLHNACNRTVTVGFCLRSFSTGNNSCNRQVTIAGNSEAGAGSLANLSSVIIEWER